MIKVAIVDDKYINRADRKLELEHSKKVKDSYRHWPWNL